MTEKAARFGGRSVGTFLMVFFLTLVLASSAAAQEKTIKVGVSLSITGPLAREGALMKKGYDLWAETVNAQGGIRVGKDTYKVRLIYYDDGGDAISGNKLVEKLITEDKVNVVFASYGSGITFATSAITEKHKVLMIAPLGSAPRIYDRGYKYIFTSYTNDIKVADQFVEFFSTLKPKSISFAVCNDLYPLSVGEYMKQSSEARKIPVVGWELFSKGTKDVTPMLMKISEKKPDIFVVSAFFQDAMNVFQQAREQNINPKLIYTVIGIGLPDFHQMLRKDAEGIYGLLGGWVPSVKRKCKVFGSTDNFLRLWAAKYGSEEPLYFSVFSAGSGIVYQRGIEIAGTLESDKVRQAILNLNEDCFYTPLHYDPKGFLDKPDVGIGTWRNGKVEYVWPPHAKTTEPIYPRAPWGAK